MNKKLSIFAKTLTKWLFNSSSISTPADDISFSYIIKYSGNVDKSDSLPMLVALHGDGDTADNFYETALDKFNVPARIVLIKAPILHEMGAVWPYSTAQFATYGEVFSLAIDNLTAKYPTVNRPILLGFSGGGTMAYYQAVKHGDSYAYIFPISGLLFNEQLGGKSSNPSAKVYAYHGRNDAVVAFSAGKEAVRLLRNRGISVSFTEFEGGHHGLFTDIKSTITLTVEDKLKSL